MASKRTLKKYINNVCEALFAECVAVSLYNQSADNENVAALLMSIVKLQGDFISRISHVEPKMPAKVYFKELKSQFNISAGEVIDNITNLD